MTNRRSRSRRKRRESRAANEEARPRSEKPLHHNYLYNKSFLFAAAVVLVGVLYVNITGAMQKVPDDVITGRNSWIHEYIWYDPRTWLIPDYSDLNLTRRSSPTRKVIVVQTNTRRCWNVLKCLEELRRLRNYQRERMDQKEILYNFLIGNDHRIYEGRGWDYRSYLFGSEGNYTEDFISVAFVGFYRTIAPTQAQQNALETLLTIGKKSQYLAPCYKVVPSNSVISPAKLANIAALYTKKLTEPSCESEP